MDKKSLKDYQEDRLGRGIYDKRNTLNDLTGKEWLFSTKTVIPKDFSSIALFEELQIPFVPIPLELASDFLNTYSKSKASVLNLFAGVGTIAIANQQLKKNSLDKKRNLIAIETNKGYLNYFELLKRHLGVKEASIVQQKTKQVINSLNDNSQDLILCDLPVWELDSLVADSKELLSDLIAEWLKEKLGEISKTIPKLKLNKYMVVGVPGDNLFNPDRKKLSSNLNHTLSGLIAELLQQQCMVLKAERIWFVPNNTRVSNSLLPLIRRFLIFRKESNLLIAKTKRANVSINELNIGSTKILHKAFPPSYEHKVRSEHGGMKPPELAQFLIELYSKNDSDLIFDPFAGVGGTLLGASAVGRQAIGIDINKRWKEIYLQVTEKCNYPPQRFYIGDSRDVISTVFENLQLDIVLTDVPYWTMDKLKKTRGRFSRAGEPSRDKLRSSLHQFNDSKIQTIDEWLSLLTQVFQQCFIKMKKGGYIIIFIGNMYRTIQESFEGKSQRIGRYHMLSYILGKELHRLGFVFDKEIIWYSPDKSLHVFGYPFSYIPSIVHQSILVFRK
ncbi:MAG: DNA methyltransferase [Candidatus Hodarchaeales archaeon]